MRTARACPQRPQRGVTVYQYHNKHTVSLAPRRAAAVRPCVVKAHYQREPFASDQLSIKKGIGEGSYGQVFEGFLETKTGKEHVVLKRVKRHVHGAEEMGAMEHLMNVHAAKVAPGSVAGFLGYCDVEHSTQHLSTGLWLVWRFEGSNTLESYIRRRDGLRALANDLGVPEDQVLAVALRQLLSALAALHAGGLVHRDVKPSNVIVSERDRRLKLIDLGACADLRNGNNFEPDEAIYDPLYCPPELYVLPTDSPRLAKSLVAQAFSSVLWARHRPDRYDSWSAGILLLCLALAPLKTDQGRINFLQQLERADWDLETWRQQAGTHMAPRDFALLDADGGAGWALACALVRPRSIEVAPSGAVSFTGADGDKRRISVAEALKHRFFRNAPQAERARGGCPAQPSSPNGTMRLRKAAPVAAPAAAAASTGRRGASTGQRARDTQLVGAGVAAADAGWRQQQVSRKGLGSDGGAGAGAAGGGLIAAAAGMLQGLALGLSGLVQLTGAAKGNDNAGSKPLKPSVAMSASYGAKTSRPPAQLRNGMWQQQRQRGAAPAAHK